MAPGLVARVGLGQELREGAADPAVALAGQPFEAGAVLHGDDPLACRISPAVQGWDFGAWLGLVPQQESTGDRTILGKISKRGNKYLRTLFVQAAHIVLVRRPHGARLGLWIEAAGRRLHRNMLVIALANKLARIAWAVLARGHAYEPRSASPAV